MYSSPIDALDELVAFTDALQAAAAEDGGLLAKAGLEAQAGVAAQLSADETAQLRQSVEGGVAKKAELAAAAQATLS